MPHGAPFSSKIVAALRLLAYKCARDAFACFGFLRSWRTCGAHAVFAPTFYLHKSQRSNAPLRLLLHKKPSLRIG